MIRPSDFRIDPELAEYFNSFWTYEMMKERRVELLLDVIETLGFEEIDDEFGLEDDRRGTSVQLYLGQLAQVRLTWSVTFQPEKQRVLNRRLSA